MINRTKWVAYNGRFGKSRAATRRTVCAGKHIQFNPDFSVIVSSTGE